MEYLVIDRITDGFAVCEDSGRNMHDIPLANLPGDISEGDCLVFTDGAYAVDKEETNRRRKENLKLLRSLLKKD